MSYPPDYCTVTDVRNALAAAPQGGSWADGQQPTEDMLTGTGADLSNDQLTDAIAEAQARVDSYITGRYVTPVLVDATGTPYTSVPHPLDYWTRNIAAYLAKITYAESQDFEDIDPVARRYNMTLLDMTAVRDGKQSIAIPENPTSSSEAAAGTVINPYVGQLFCPSDFDLYPIGSAWPFIGPGRDSW
jgi:phage gp36-like protein